MTKIKLERSRTPKDVTTPNSEFVVSSSITANHINGRSKRGMRGLSGKTHRITETKKESLMDSLSYRLLDSSSLNSGSLPLLL